jgi:hypothetical protein
MLLICVQDSNLGRIPSVFILVSPPRKTPEQLAYLDWATAAPVQILFQLIYYPAIPRFIFWVLTASLNTPLPTSISSRLLSNSCHSCPSIELRDYVLRAFRTASKCICSRSPTIIQQNLVITSSKGPKISVVINEYRCNRNGHFHSSLMLVT